MRYTLLYGAMFLLCGVGLIVLIAALGLRDTMRSVPAGGSAPGEQIAQLRQQLADADAAHERQLLIGAVAALAVMLLLALLLGLAAAGRVLRPLRTITAATRRISADNLHARLAVRGPADEVKALADTIDDLLQRLEESFAAQRRFVADASHELRTPLATMRASIDVAMAKPGPVPPPTRQLAGRLLDSLDQVDGLLEGFLVLARAQHGALDDRAPADLGALCAAALEAHGLPPAPGLPSGVIVRGNEVLLARMVGNVIDNAVRHNVPGGGVEVTVAPAGDRAVLIVESDGPVLDPGQVSRLGRPFHRLGADRTGAGTGLGLSIVAAVAAAHGGELTLTARPAGGLRVEISLPAAAAVPA
ncbi:MAG: HAMP domain-containing sensor histidine kinase [Actinoplanes sp.]